MLCTSAAVFTHGSLRQK